MMDVVLLEAEVVIIKAAEPKTRETDKHVRPG